MSTTTIHSFIPLQRIGEGTFSSVYKIRRISDNNIYALKKIKIASLKEKEKDNALNQIRILASLSSQYIVTYKEAFFDENLKLLCIVMQLANDGDLLHRINQHKDKGTNFTQQEIWKVLYHLTMGLDTLHANRVLHRDMKSANIFISNGIYKIGDLNVSKVVQDQKLVRTQTGTPFYASPEVWRDQPYGQKSDIWSLGCIVYELCALRPPFGGESLDQLFRNVQKGSFRAISGRYSKQLQQVVEKCLSLRPEQRPSTRELLHHDGLLLTKCDFYQIAIEKQSQHHLKQPFLETIKMPYDITQLNNQLPHAQYDKYNPSEVTRSALMPKEEVKQSGSNKMARRQGTLPSQLQPNEQKMYKNQSDIIPSLKAVIPSLPERIKSHLQEISHKQPNRRPKTRVQTSAGSRERPLLRPLDRTPIIGAINSKKMGRPQSCETRSRGLYRINNRPFSGVLPGKAKKSPKAAYPNNSSLLHESSLLDKNRYRRPDSSLIRPSEIKKQDSNRCKSAEMRRPVNSSYLQLKKRFEVREQQLNRSSLYPEHNKVKHLEQIAKSEANIRSNAVPFITKDVYLKTPMQVKKLERPQQDRRYLEQIQNKILSSAGSNCANPKRCVPMTSSVNLTAQRVKGTYNKYRQHVLY